VPREKNELKTFPTKYEKPCSICQGTTKVAVDLTYKVGSKWMAVHVDCLPQVQPKNAFESIDINELNRIKNDLIVNHPPKIDKTLDIIIDEGQDLPDVFYQLIHQFARSITVYADGAQVINDGLKKTLPEDIAATLEIEAGNRKLLVKNYRNAQEVALLAESFRPRDVVPAQLPTRKCTELPQVVSGNSLNELAGHVELIAKNFSNKSIGIFVKLKKERDDLAKHFSDHGFTKFQKYDPENNWKSKQTIDPCAKGVFIATNTVAKGLEFDIVIAACLESWPATPSEAEEGTFYVLLSRSKDVLKLAYNGSDEPIFFNSEKYQQKLKSISRMSLS
jgi:superfamily I DNA/RNA helicase